MTDASASIELLVDIWILIWLIVPGFITFKLISWFGAYRIKPEKFTMIIYSLICSLVSLLPIALIYEIESLQQAREQVTTFTVLLQLVGFSVLFGFVAGMILKYTIRRPYKLANAWDEFAFGVTLHKDRHNFVTVYTQDNMEYVGWG